MSLVDLDLKGKGPIFKVFLDSKTYLAKLVDCSLVQRHSLNSQLVLLPYFQHIHILKLEKQIYERRANKLGVTMEELYESRAHELPDGLHWKVLQSLVNLLKSLEKGEQIRTHSNIHPSNILLDKNFRLKIGPFGYSLRSEAEAKAFAQYEARPQSDVYSLGMLIKFMIRTANLKDPEMLRLAKWCTLSEEKERASMEQLSNVPDISLLNREQRLKENLRILQVREAQVSKREQIHRLKSEQYRPKECKK